jgi:hypothetical protein
MWQYLDWNNGMLDSWNDGLKETSIQNAYYSIIPCRSSRKWP